MKRKPSNKLKEQTDIDANEFHTKLKEGFSCIQKSCKTSIRPNLAKTHQVATSLRLREKLKVLSLHRIQCLGERLMKFLRLKYFFLTLNF